MSGTAAAATSVCRLQHVRELRVPSRCSCRQFLFPLSGARERHAEKFRHRTAVLTLLWVTNSASLGKRR